MSLVLLVWTFDSYWWIGPISLITSWNVYTKRINSTKRTRNSTLLWRLLWYQVIISNSNIFWISINVFQQSFPNYVLKTSGYIFWVLGCFDSKLLSKSPLKVCELKYSKMFRQFSKGSLISVSLVIKNSSFNQSLYRPIWFNLCRQYFLFHVLNVFLRY